MPYTTRGIALLHDWSLRGVALPTHFYLALVTAAAAPTSATKTLSEMTQIASGNGYTAGGYQLSPNTTDFSSLVEDDTNHWTTLGVKTVTWTASGGDIPASGGAAVYVVLTTDEATSGNRQIIWYAALGASRTVPSGQTFTLSGVSGRIQGGAPLKSVQRGTIAITGTTASGTGTITSVDTNKSRIKPLGVETTGFSTAAAAADTRNVGIRLELTNATMVTAYRGDGGSVPDSSSIKVGYEVEEDF